MTAMDGIFKVTGPDPQIAFNLSNLNLSGEQADLLLFTFECISRHADPRIRVFWWGDRQVGPTEKRSMKFSAEDGALIVPLDVFPRWRLLGRVAGLRIDLDNANACEAVRFSDISLLRRL